MNEEEMFSEFKKFFTDLFEKYFGKKEAVAPVAKAVIDESPPITVLPPHDTPDANGLVGLSGVSNERFVNMRHQIKEVSDTLPAGTFQRMCAQLNLGRSLVFATMQGIFGFTAIQVEEYFNVSKGTNDFRFKDPEVGIDNAYSWPPVEHNGFNLAKVQGVTDYINSLE
jgi:hypothetical protein